MKAPDAWSPVFIGGSGRCGTTILKRLLARHPAIFALNHEVRFLTDPDGLRTLCDALSAGWSAPTTDQAMRRFRTLMKALRRHSPVYYMQTGLYRVLKIEAIRRAVFRPYISFALGADIGWAHYDQTVRDFQDELTAYRFSGRWVGQSGPDLHPRVQLGTLLQREQALSASAAFITRLLAPAMETAGADRWCDDTPSNLQFAGFLAELFPRMKLVHIVRDPRDVIASAKSSPWASPRVEDLLHGMSMLQQKWARERDTLQPGQLHELRLEDLAGRPEETWTDLLEFLELEPMKWPSAFDLSRHHSGRYRQDLSTREIALIEENTGDWMARYQYHVSVD